MKFFILALVVVGMFFAFSASSQAACAGCHHRAPVCNILKIHPVRGLFHRLFHR